MQKQIALASVGLRRKRWFIGVLCVTATIGALLLSVAWYPAYHRMNHPISMTEWDIDDCILSKFSVPTAVAKLFSPLPLSYCSVQWAPGYLLELDSQLKAMRFDDEPTVWRKFQESGDEYEKLFDQERFRELGALRRILGLLPILHAYKFGKPDPVARSIKDADIVRPEVTAQLRMFASRIDWNRSASITNPKPHRFRVRHAPTIFLISDRLKPLTTDSLSFSLFSRQYAARTLAIDQTDQNGNRLLDQLPANMLFEPSDYFALLALEFVFDDLTQRSKLINVGSSNDRYGWERYTKDGPLTIYYVKDSSYATCGGHRADHTAFFCPEERTIFSGSSTGYSLFSEKTSTGALFFPPDLLHELAHFFLNPKAAAQEGFVSEAIATAFGEEAARAARAGMSSQISVDTRKKVATALSRVSADMTSSEIAEINELVKPYLEAQAFTTFQAKALCNLDALPMAEEAVLRWLRLE